MSDDSMRNEAEHQYATTAFDYASNPVGSRDWTLYWKGWQASLEARAPSAEPVAKPSHWAAVDDDGEIAFSMKVDDGNEGLAARQEVNDWINENDPKLHLYRLYLAPLALIVTPTQTGQWNKAAARAWRDAVLTGSASVSDRLLVVSAHVAGQRAALGDSLEATLTFPNGEVGGTPLAPSVPNGWKLAPIQPTYDMVQAGAKLVKDNLPCRTGTLDIYTAMLAAAPEAPKP